MSESKKKRIKYIIHNMSEIRNKEVNIEIDYLKHNYNTKHKSEKSPVTDVLNFVLVFIFILTSIVIYKRKK